MKRAIVIAILLLSTATVLSAQAPQGGGRSAEDGNCGLIYGKSHAFTVCAPKGWILDNSILNEEGIYAVFYPAGTSWSSAKDNGSVMYVNTAAKKGENSTVDELIATDAEDTKSRAPSSVIKKCEAITLAKSNAPVQCFTPGDFSRFEAVAYVDSPKIIVMFVLTSKDDQTFKQDYPAFIALVKSYAFLSSDVTIKTK